ncbi:diiron oxygenase [Saccharothrix sp. ST-888]|uniref:diiron oxygenase n=1 Tax=Saccharothrix sp. ST-888 TaxID=1427391 RepID=UPI0005EC54F3|nr:diiron oxygenase [Saccharothrix sp. ST-888]KJK55555.1 AurF domain containing protein [Saccharothrix sp. ST-888]
MTAATLDLTDRFRELLDRLSQKSIEDYYNPYQSFDWADELPEDAWWMSPDLVSAYGSALYEGLDEATLKKLSKWESINFYSLNVHGIRELIIEVVDRIHTPGFEIPSDFFHHFIGEENEHMWFFAEFCRRYGDKIYAGAALKSAPAEKRSPEVENFLVFARILFFEEMVDFYNMRMGQDTSLHETIRQVNRIHHQDESRHIAFGRELVSHLYHRMKASADETELREVEAYLKRYIVFSLHSFYNPHVYRDAGIADPLAMRDALINDEGRKAVQRKVIRKPMAFFLKSGIFADDTLPD